MREQHLGDLHNGHSRDQTLSITRRVPEPQMSRHAFSDLSSASTIRRHNTTVPRGSALPGTAVSLIPSNVDVALGIPGSRLAQRLERYLDVRLDAPSLEVLLTQQELLLALRQ
jgi:hypothetical protein